MHDGIAAALAALDALEARLGWPPVVTLPLLEQARAAVLALAPGVSRREQVAELAAQGLGVRAIARRLHISPGSVHRALRAAPGGAAND